MKKTVFISIEIKSRELNSQILLSYYLLKKNFNVYIGSTNSIIFLLKNLNKKVGIYLYKGGQEKVINYLVKKKCFSHVVIDQELGITVKNFDQKIKKRFFPDQLGFLDRFYCIGNNAYKSAQKYFSNTSCQPVLTGWPRVDLWKTDYRRLYDDQIKNINNKYGNFILFSSDFGFLNKNSIRERIRDLDWNDQIENNDKNQIIESKRNQVKHNLSDFNNFINFLKECDKDYRIPKIIVRPHPAENIFVWKKILKNFKKTFVIFEGDISIWLYSSICLIHRGCTTSVQAQYSSIPSFYFGRKRSDINNIPYDISEKINSVNDLFNNLNKIQNKKIESKFDKIVNKNTVIIGQKDSCEKIADDIDNLNCEITSNIKIHFALRILINFQLKFITLKSIIKIILLSLKYFSLNTLSTYLLKLEGKIHKYEIKTTLKNIAIIKKDDIDFNIKKIYENLYEISNK